MVVYLVITFSSILAGCVQAVTGFGGGIMQMQFLPYFFPMNVAPAIGECTCTPLNWAIAWNYRKQINWRLVWIPTICYMAFSTLSIWLSTKVDLGGLKLVFGIFLIVLSIYFIFFSGKLKVSGSLFTAFLCSSVSGLLSGLFGIGGPTMAMYYLAVTNGKEEYLGTMNMVFAFCMIYQLIARFTAGILTFDMIPILIVGIAGVLVGRIFGSKIVDRIDGEKLKKIVYIFLAVSGVITTINAL